MNSLINIIFPSIIILAFSIFLIYQIFHKKKKDSDNLYKAHSSNGGTPVDEEFKILEAGEYKPDFLGCKGNG